MEPVTVWRVQLRRGDVREREGTLRLEDDAIVFEERESAQQARIALSTVASARRVRASPILMVDHDDVDGRARTAFYFSQPPPLDMPAPGSAGTSSMGRPLGPFAAIRRTSKRRHQRENVRYLTTTAAGVKATIREWEDEIGARTKR